MYAKHLEDFVIKNTENMDKAFWKLSMNDEILVVVDENDKFQGVLTPGRVRKFQQQAGIVRGGGALVSEMCKQNCKYIISDGDDSRTIRLAQSLFLDNWPAVRNIPVIDEDGNVLDIISRTRAFWKMNFIKKKLPRMHYATCIWEAAMLAKRLGLSRFSVIEFGVAGGNGLVNCELHAKEISRLTGCEIEIYGFDLGSGLPENHSEKDSLHLWPAGSYKMDEERLRNRLTCAKLVMGDIAKTLQTFLEDYSPAPIAVMFVDVDYYSSTLPILEFLKREDKYFYPRIYMYFDDISLLYDFTGEDLAVKEFNAQSETIKISPERLSANVLDWSDKMARIKLCHRLKHELYNYNDDGTYAVDLKSFI